jgi:hypothetical protein
MSVHRFIVPVLLGLLVLAFPLDACAYLDVGTGSYLFQLAIAGFFAGLMTIKLYYHRIMMWFRALRAPAPAPTDKSSGPTPT